MAKTATETVKTEDDLMLKMLLFQMHQAGVKQDVMAAYLNRGKQTINAILKPLQDKGENRGS